MKKLRWEVPQLKSLTSSLAWGQDCEPAGSSAVGCMGGGTASGICWNTGTSATDCSDGGDTG